MNKKTAEGWYLATFHPRRLQELWHYFRRGVTLCDRPASDFKTIDEQTDVMTPGHDNCDQCVEALTRIETRVTLAERAGQFTKSSTSRQPKVTG